MIMRGKTLRSVDLNLLVVLQALLETRNATFAARRLNMSQPAVSRALARLRQVFEDRLFVKSARGLTATPRAEALGPSLAQLMREIGVIVDGPRFSAKASDRVFRLAASDYGAMTLGPTLAGIMRRKAPRAGLDILAFAPDVFLRLATGDVDLALFNDDPVPNGLKRQWLFNESYTCLVRKGNPILRGAAGRRLSLADFLEQAHVLVSIMGGRAGIVDDALAALGKRRRIAMWLPYFVTAALVVARTDLIVTLPHRATLRLAKPHGLVALTPPVEIASFGYQMVWHECTHTDSGSVWLREMVAEAARTGV
jgi:DNA-binding transcriptional LysR family regulator